MEGRLVGAVFGDLGLSGVFGEGWECWRMAEPMPLGMSAAHTSWSVSYPCLLSFHAVLSAHGSTASSCIPEHGVHFDGLTDWA
ncbi:unnamed protein product [Prunus armeniaca]